MVTRDVGAISIGACRMAIDGVLLLLCVLAVPRSEGGVPEHDPARVCAVLGLSRVAAGWRRAESVREGDRLRTDAARRRTSRRLSGRPTRKARFLIYVRAQLGVDCQPDAAAVCTGSRPDPHGSCAERGSRWSTCSPCGVRTFQPLGRWVRPASGCRGCIGRISPGTAWRWWSDATSSHWGWGCPARAHSTDWPNRA